MCSCKISLS